MIRTCETCQVSPGSRFCALDSGKEALRQAKDAGVLDKPLVQATIDLRQGMASSGCARAIQENGMNRQYEPRKKIVRMSFIPTDGPLLGIGKSVRHFVAKDIAEDKQVFKPPWYAKLLTRPNKVSWSEKRELKRNARRQPTE
jgi:hypothetical protein